MADSTITREGDLIEAVARAIFEADEDIVEAQEARLRAAGETVAADCLAGPRARWDDPRNASILDAFRQRARAAIRAYRATEGRIMSGPVMVQVRDCAVCACEPEPIPNCPGCGGVGGFTKVALATGGASSPDVEGIPFGYPSADAGGGRHG